MNYLSYQDEKRRIVEEPSQANFATVVGVYEDGLQLQFDGETESSSKKYRYNQSITFKLGDRVKVTRVSGTYVAEYPIGKGKFSVAPDNVSGINATAGETEVSIQWSDPADKTVDGQVVSKWSGTYLVRNEVDFPKNETDGTQLLNSQIRNAYKSTPFIDKGLTPNKTYYYGLFPYSDDGKVNTNRENTFSLMPERRYQYGVKIDLNNADPETSVEYILDAVGKRPARVNLETGEFDYGDWADVGFVKDCKPCMLRYDGTVDYYLNPNDYSKKEDGTPSNISDINYPANAMVEFPRWYLTQYQDENYLYIVLSEDKIDDNSQAYAFMHYDGTIGNKLYISMFVIGGNSSRPMMSIDNIPASTYTDKDFTQNISKNFGGNFLWSNYCERDYIASLLIVMSKRLDLQRAFGFGPKTQYKTGNTVSASFFGKDSVYDEPVNVFHLKNWWGDPYMLGGCGLMSDKSYLTPTICIMYYPGYGLWNHFKEYGIKYTIQPNGSPVGYISQMHPSYGTKFPEKFQGSQTTFYQSYCDWSMSKNEQWSYLLCGESKHVAIGSQSILAYDLTTDHEESLQGKMRVSYRK